MIRRGLATCAAVLSLLPVAAACGGDSDGGSKEIALIEVSVEGDAVTSDDERIDVDLDQPVDIVITSDEPGVLHVHSSPEQTFEFDTGTNAPIELQFDRPGVVDIELHEPFEAPVVSLAVS